MLHLFTYICYLHILQDTHTLDGQQATHNVHAILRVSSVLR